MSEQVKIATWNLCLGLLNKKDYVDYKLKEENIDICCLQECEVPPNLDEKTLTLNNFKIELKLNQRKKNGYINPQ